MFLWVYKCKLALEIEDNITAYGTCLRDLKISIDATDILVVILYPFQPNALLPFPLSENISTIREGVGYEVLWPIAFVIDDENDEVNTVIPKLLKLSYIFLYSWFILFYFFNAMCLFICV